MSRRFVPAVVLVAVAVAPSAAWAAPSKSAVNRKVSAAFNQSYSGEDGRASCRKTGARSWSCKIRTETDRLRKASGIASGDGTSVTEMDNNWYSYSATARTSGNKIYVGEIRDHDYDH